MADAAQNSGAQRDALLESLAISRGGMTARALVLVVATVPVVALLGMPLLLGWLAALLLWDGVLVKPLERGWVAPMIDTDLMRARVRRASMVLLGLSLSQVLPIAAWSAGTAFGAVVGAVWVLCSATQVFVYYSRDRMLLIAGMAPVLLCALIGPSLSGISSQSLVTSLFVLIALGAGAAFVGRSDALIAKAAEEAAGRRTAEAASFAKSRFIANMHHELRTPLNAIIGYSEMLREAAQDDGRAADVADLDRVLAAARLQLLMMTDLLAFSELQDGQSELNIANVDVAVLARDAIDALRSQIESNGNVLSCAIDDELGAVCTDAVKLRHCLDHLISNAGKFTRDGEVRVRLHREQSERGAWLVVTVEDTGVGIPAERLSDIFEPFTQADESATRRFDGAGVGLAITARFARLMGGAVSVESAPGQGSIFALRVRADFAAAEPERQRA